MKRVTILAQAPASRLPHPALMALLGVLLCLASAPGLGIIIRHDLAEDRYLANPVDYPQVFTLHERYGNRSCVASLIAARWAITAAHCATQSPLEARMRDGQPYPVTIAGVENSVTAVTLHPDYELASPAFPMGVDLALLKLAEPAVVRPLKLLRRAVEPEQVGVLLGWGFTGTGSQTRRYNDGDFRRAENRVFRAAQWLEFRFDDPRQTEAEVLPLEGIPGLGDSGGPALLEADGEKRLMGVARGELVNGEGPVDQGRYGGIAMYERVSLHLQWIDGHITEDAFHGQP